MEWRLGVERALRTEVSTSSEVIIGVRREEWEAGEGNVDVGEVDLLLKTIRVKDGKLKSGRRG